MMKRLITRFIAVAIGLLFLIAVGVVVLPLCALASMAARTGASHPRTAEAQLGSRSSSLISPEFQTVTNQAGESGRR